MTSCHATVTVLSTADSTLEDKFVQIGPGKGESSAWK